MDKGAQMVLTMNLPDTFFEFYDVFEAVLKRKGQEEELTRMKEHIFAKRKPVEYWKKVILAAGFRIRSINIAEFKLSFLNGTAFLNHSFIRTAFLGPWEAITSDPEIFDAIQATLNYQAGKRGQLTMTVPYVCMDCFKD